MKLLGSTKQGVDEDKDGVDVPKVEPVEVVLVHCSSVNNNAENTTTTEVSSSEVWFTDQNSKPLQIEDNVNMTQIIGRYYKNEVFN